MNKFHYVSIIALAGIIMIASQNTFSYAQPLTPEPFFNSGSAQGLAYVCYTDGYANGKRVFFNTTLEKSCLVNDHTRQTSTYYVGYVHGCQASGQQQEVCVMTAKMSLEYEPKDVTQEPPLDYDNEKDSIKLDEYPNCNNDITNMPCFDVEDTRQEAGYSSHKGPYTAACDVVPCTPKEKKEFIAAGEKWPEEIYDEAEALLLDKVEERRQEAGYSSHKGPYISDCGGVPCTPTEKEEFMDAGEKWPDQIDEEE